MYVARRDFFLSGEASRVYTFLTIAVSDRIFSPAPGAISRACSENSRPLFAVRSRARRAHGKSQSKLSTVALWDATAGAIKSEQPTNWEEELLPARVG